MYQTSIVTLKHVHAIYVNPKTGQVSIELETQPLDSETTRVLDRLFPHSHDKVAGLLNTEAVLSAIDTTRELGDLGNEVYRNPLDRMETYVDETNRPTPKRTRNDPPNI